jgi:hypothetical protein
VMLLRRVVSALLRSAGGGEGALSFEGISAFGVSAPPEAWGGGSGVITVFGSASTLTTDTCGAIGSIVIGSALLPMKDLGRKRPTSDRVDFFIPLPIFRNIIDAEEAVDEIDKLSVEPVKKRVVLE